MGMLVRSRDVSYFDNNATTQISVLVYESMIPYLTELYGNPSSGHKFGSQVAKAVDTAREQIANLLDCDPSEVLFTSCGTESNNSVLSSAVQSTGHRHIVTTAVEHSAIKNHAEHLERLGYAVTVLPVAEDGTLKVDDVEKAIRADTAIVSIMWANNETGVLFPVEEIAKVCKSKGVLFHTDAVQTPGKLRLSLKDSSIDFLSLSGHKLHAPKGVGVLYVRRRTPFVPYLIGGHQEKGKRGGTENVASIVAMGKAAELTMEDLDHEIHHVKELRDTFEQGVLDSIPDVLVNGHRELRLPNTSNLSFMGVDATALLVALDQQKICASAGSACTTGSLQPSHVLRAMNMENPRALSAIRFSFGRYNSMNEVQRALRILPQIVDDLRKASPKN